MLMTKNCPNCDSVLPDEWHFICDECGAKICESCNNGILIRNKLAELEIFEIGVTTEVYECNKCGYTTTHTIPLRNPSIPENSLEEKVEKIIKEREIREREREKMEKIVNMDVEELARKYEKKIGKK